MDIKQETTNEAGRITGTAKQLPSGRWRPISRVVVFTSGCVGADGDPIAVPVPAIEYDNAIEAARAGLDAGYDWFEKNVPRK